MFGLSFGRLGCVAGSGAAAPAAFVGILDELSVMPVQAASMNFRLTADYTGGPMTLRDKTTEGAIEAAFDDDGVTDYAAIATALGGHTGAVAAVHDQVGSADAEQGTAASQGDYVPNDIDGRAVVHFSAATEKMGGTLPAGPSGNGNHVIVLVGAAINTNLGSLNRLTGVGDFSSSSAIAKSISGGGTKRWTWGGGFLDNQNGTHDADEGPHIFIKRHTSGTTVGRVDGAQDFTGSLTFNLDALSFQWNNDGTAGFNFGGNTKIAEVWWFNGTITNDDVDLIEAWAADKYGITLA